MKKILLIESKNHHEEVILPQLNYLENSPYLVHLFINESIKKKGVDLSKYDITLNYIPAKKMHFNLLSIYHILRYIKKNDIDIVLFNTVEDKYAKAVNFFLSHNIFKVGVVHNVDKLEKKDSNIKNYFVLSQTILDNIKKHPDKNYNYFYPLIDESINLNIKITNTKSIKICIPGKITLGRRDYFGLMDMLRETNININITFVILGNMEANDGPAVLKRIQEYNLNRYFKYYNGYVPYDEYFSILSTSDYIMPLIHPKMSSFQRYHTVKFSASFSMGLSFKIPFLMYESLANLKEFHDFSLSYTENTFLDTQDQLKEISKQLKKKMIAEKKISVAFQRNNYIHFLNNLIL